MSIVGSIKHAKGPEFLKFVFQEGCILVNDWLSVITGLNIPFEPPLPLVGFQYAPSQHIELLKYEYSEYPYVDKRMITNSVVKQQTHLDVIAYRPICSVEQGGMPFLGAVAMNELYYTLLQLYCDRGGTFTLISPAGIFTDLVIEEFSCIPSEEVGGEGRNHPGGIAFRFRFKKILFSKGLLARMADTLMSPLLGML